MRQKTIIFLYLIFASSLLAQPPANRYTSALFANVTEATNVLFSTNVPQPNPGGGFYEALTGFPLNVDEFSTTNVNLSMNIFRPTGDTLSKRPVIIICFGGGFITGSKDHWSMRLLAIELAKRGFVTAVIDYRLGMNIFDEDLSKRAVYRGVQDGRSAVRFFKADAAGANIYKVDPNQIYIGGHSAGAFIATHNAYLDKEAERPASTYTWTQGCGLFNTSICTCPDQGCLDCVGNNTSYSGHARAIFSLAGAVGDLNYMETANDPICVLFHSSDDDTVPYNSGQPFGSVSGWIVGFDLPICYGSNLMSQRATTINLPKQFYPYTNRGHNVHEETASTLYSNIVPNISQWFFDKLLKPIDHAVTGKTSVCTGDLVQTYHTIPGQAKYYLWEVTGGQFISMNPSSNQVTVSWNASAPVHTLKLTPYSIWDGKGNTTTKNINVASSFQNSWLVQNGNWNNDQNWSLIQVPDYCHNVVIGPASNPRIIDIPANLTYAIKSLNLGSNATLNLNQNSQLFIKQ